MIALLVCLILVAVAVEDFRRYRIRNSAVLLLVGCFVLEAVTSSRSPAVLPHVLLALAGLILMVVGYALGWAGGGDAKLLPAALLWVGPENAVVFSLCLMIATLAYRLGVASSLVPARRTRRGLVIPFGPSIASAWIATIALGS